MLPSRSGASFCERVVASKYVLEHGVIARIGYHEANGRAGRPASAVGPEAHSNRGIAVGGYPPDSCLGIADRHDVQISGPKYRLCRLAADDSIACIESGNGKAQIALTAAKCVAWYREGCAPLI